MFENFSNLIFIAVAIAVFIGRTVAQAKKKREQEEAPPPPPPRAPTLHFEEKEEDDFVRRIQPAKPKPPAKKPAVAAKVATPARKDTVPPAITAEQLFPTRAVPIAAAAQNQGDFSFNLNHLSPLKQAVIMAEILGPPKALSTNTGVGER